MDGGGPQPRSGDLSLVDLLAFHGLAMNGGVHHALEVLSPEQVTAAEAGFTYFEMGEVARLLWKLRSDAVLNEWTDSSEVEANSLYASIVPNDQLLAERFERKYRQRPEDFSPLETDSMAV